MKRSVPFFRPDIREQEIADVVATLRSGWLTTGPQVRKFESEFAAAVGACHAVAVNSCTAALHLSVEALRLRPFQAVLVPTMTFAATAEVVRYQGGLPILIDCDPVTGNMDLKDAERKLTEVKSGRLQHLGVKEPSVVGMIPVHVGGFMMDVDAVGEFASRHGLWVVEDAAHAFPAAWRSHRDAAWRRCGENTAASTCFSFYANKTITTGEGGMVVTHDGVMAQRMRSMSLHGLSYDAWNRYANGATWDYQIIAPGFKYNLTDIAASIGIHQLRRSEQTHRERENIAGRYMEAFKDMEEIALPTKCEDRVQSWHLFPIRVDLSRLSIDRNEFVSKLKERGVGCSVHWRPLHLHPYYATKFAWQPKDFPVATSTWARLVSLPIFPGMLEDEIQHVILTVKSLCAEYTRRPAACVA